jgi:hypothetical protein
LDEVLDNENIGECSLDDDSSSDSNYNWWLQEPTWLVRVIEW